MRMSANGCDFNWSTLERRSALPLFFERIPQGLQAFIDRLLHIPEILIYGLIESVNTISERIQRLALTGGEVSEVIGLILENISGFETVDSQTLTQTINEIRK